MGRKHDWELANKKAKRQLSITDENEYREVDAAARWLEFAEERIEPKLGETKASTERRKRRKQKNDSAGKTKTLLKQP